ncbi:bifunctional 3-(3-hydroxy-phenyl)propionate/3-hydroxycinnamic acid hydroxylase [Flexivirga caeni]|uniref:Bifunctional 3-(3-hydroxy-phenyl)propionate/3-hydroxycinnamic acid hydroxylase n=1 Tax=Flexivirga caeni TaxID=2294115 RepID=A0A3M9MCQ1_9MICO|nr:bifunctional 3-(3-hydroxy-phenyl)propionate/3-hydroxycinnamic acid hydroxylase [Flexivirga caeni]RNI22937.1 bifunctional 3-(3-hydroxy-phenyl)propionate/3-hydroxycinnamic acid hydroxylase [Flexivirga caeni]
MSAPANAQIRVPVAIVGAGPVGVTAANLLGTYGIATLLVDRANEIIDYPRAIGIDDESLRTFQSVGLADDVLADAIQNVPLKMIDAKGHCLADMHPTGRDSGWFKRNIFMQPLAEKTLRTGVERFTHVRAEWGLELRVVEPADDSVTLTLAGADGRAVTVVADWVVAADGGRSTIRTQLGIPLDGATHPRKWVVIDCGNDPVDAPYTALHCDPRRPYVCARLPYDHRRWEFMLYPGEDAEEMLAPERVRDLLGQHVPDPAAIEVIRARVYTHHSRIARRFVQGRVVLVGDAAHLMPPWAGQGMNTGIRDVTNLCWKLAAIVRGDATPALLHTYEQERRAHAQAMIDLSTTLGRILSPTNQTLAHVRNWLLRAASAAPPVKQWILEMRFKAQPHYQSTLVTGEPLGCPIPTLGRMFPQPTVETEDGLRLALDDVLGPWFAIIGFNCDPLAGLNADQSAALAALGAVVVRVVESRAGERRRRQPCVDPDTVVVEDADNALRTWFGARKQQVVLLRPDRYVAVLARVETFGAEATMFARHLTEGAPL